MGRLFGTDGIRDRVDRPDGIFASDQLLRLGWALAEILGPGKRVYIARDPRRSGIPILKTLASSLREKGIHVSCAFPEGLPTPGVAFTLRNSGEYEMGIVISASHNPPEYNGLKFFDRDGLKLSEAKERQIEETLDHQLLAPSPGQSLGEPLHADTLRHREAYVRHLQGQLETGSLQGWKVAVDSAHGATAGMFQTCLKHWGAIPFVMADTEAGERINVKCGATDPEGLQKIAKSSRCRLGVAFDGDGDRCVFVDERGRVVDGDAVLYVFAKDLKAQGLWKKRAVVATEISNFGLDRAIRRLGGKVIRVPVGDRNVVQRMRRGGCVLGGESSGHVILPESGLTGDGMLTAAHMLGVMRRSRKRLSALVLGYASFPSVSLNVRVTRKPSFAEVPELARAIREGAAAIGREGRILVRYSGTEPLLRILAEGPERARLQGVVSRVAEAAGALS